jgi:hypothetical protein
MKLAEVSGKPWSLPSDYSTFHAPGVDPASRTGGRKGDYQNVTLSIEHFQQRNDPRFLTIWADRGENLPVLIDTTPVKALKDAGNPPPFRVLVLRLSGAVEFVNWDGKNSLDIVLRQ